MKNITTSIYTFQNMIEGDWFYIDKTEFFWNLVKKPQGIFFLSRPRRFGKSLALSTLKAIFQGKKELFKGLAISEKTYNWQPYPVIHLDLGDRPADTAEILNKSLCNSLAEAAMSLGLELTSENSAECFRELVLKAGQDSKVVILIDEYDKPILDNATGKKLAEVKAVLESFYAVIKATESYQRFVFLTGVSKFSKVSVFSKLNNMTDLTMDGKYATMLGFTQEELEENYTVYIDEVVTNQNIKQDELLNKLKIWYNGYKFEQHAETVYNPVSISKFFESGGEFRNFWFTTGTPTFLLKLAREQHFDFESALTEPVSELAFDSYEIDNLKPLPLLFQTGYLTIKSTETIMDSTLYYLGFPNREVEMAFEAYLVDEYTHFDKEKVEVNIVRMVQDLMNGQIDNFMEKLQHFFAKIPYDIRVAQEKYYQTVFYIIFRMLGIFIEVESRTNSGRIDAVIKTQSQIFLFEFKLNQSADAALQQINNKKYYQKYLDSGKTIYLIGAKFCTKTRSIEKWQTQKL